MASDTEQTGGDSGLSKAVWHYISVGVLWLGLILTGLAFERLGLTTSYLTGILPGEVNSLRTQVAELEGNNQELTHDRDRAAKTRNTLEVEVNKLKRLQRELEAEIDELKAVPAAMATPSAS
ncbi:MAG: hypothetical protein OXC18_11700 [Desulfurellaceae bacterium]|nr:hypothetical protein [Desulfurellaceae bacterium]